MVQIINYPLCLDCGIKLEQIDELIERLQGFYAKFCLLLACTECSKKRNAIKKDNYSDDDDNNDDNDDVHNDEHLYFEQNFIESTEIFHTSEKTEKLKIEPQISDTESIDNGDIPIQDLPKREPKKKHKKSKNIDETINISLPIVCEPCGKEFNAMVSLRRHMSAAHHKKRKVTPYERARNCRLCFEHFTKPTIRSTHEQTAHFDAIKKVYKCSECDFVDKLFGTVAAHRLTHNSFACSICGIVKKSFNLWRYHHRRHTQKRKPTAGLGNCVVCDKSFEFRKDLTIHERTQHKNPLTKCFKCNQCDFETSQRRLIRDHIIEHTGRMPYICDVCGCGHSSQLLLQNHIKREHINKPKYQCHICQKVCHQKSSLVRHILVHTPDERPHKCNMCDKTYRDATDLRRHKRSHGNIVPKLACDKCEKRFYEPKQLRTHQRIYGHY